MGFKVLFIIGSILISACESKVEPKIVDVNKTQKVQSMHNWETAEELLFLWTPPKGPKGHDSKCIINNDIMLFTPDMPGEYSISLIIENLSGDVLGEESFLLIAEEQTKKVLQSSTLAKKSTPSPTVPKKREAKKKIDLPSKKPIVVSPVKEVKEKVADNRAYTIQVSAWPSLEEARKDQLSLTKYGIDAYTQRIFIKKKNAYWWRVRVGNFSHKDQVNKVKKQIEDLRGSSVWIDRIDEN